MGGSYRKGGGLEEMGVEPTLMANQMRRGANVGEESWQEAEWGSVGVCQSKSAGGAAILQHKARGCYEHSANCGPREGDITMQEKASWSLVYQENLTDWKSEGGMVR